MSKVSDYLPLSQYLQKQDAFGMTQVKLTFQEIDWQRIDKFNPSVEKCIAWLSSKNLMRASKDLRIRNGTEFVEADKILC
jgi:hypothetical protein